jgi:hypothetical protein
MNKLLNQQESDEECFLSNRSQKNRILLENENKIPKTSRFYVKENRYK